MVKLDIKACGLSLGIVWSLGILLAGLLGAFFNYGLQFVELFGSFYIGYSPTLLGSIIGAVWGFVDGFIFGILAAWLYNKFSKQMI